MFANSHYHLRL